MICVILLVLRANSVLHSALPVPHLNKPSRRPLSGRDEPLGHCPSGRTSQKKYKIYANKRRTRGEHFYVAANGIGPANPFPNPCGRAFCISLSRSFSLGFTSICNVRLI